MSPPPEPVPATAPTSPPRGVPLIRTILCMIASFGFMFILGSFYSIVTSGIQEARQSSSVQSAHAIGLAMYDYAHDHAGKYPEGKSSTEVFQQLLDQGYITDPTLFYFPMTGKTKPEGNKLKPENVSWDVTNAARSDDPDSLPLVFMTGYKIDYASGGKTHRLDNGDPAGIPIFYVNNAVLYIYAPAHYPSFDPKGKMYLQLTPNGPLP